MSRRARRTVVRFLVVSVLLGTVGCGGGEASSPDAAPPVPASTEPDPITEPAPSATSEPTAEPGASEPTPGPDTALEDGRHPAYLVGLDVPGGTVTVDVIQFLTGDEAIAAYREDTPEDPDGDPPNDYFIRNDNPLLRTLPVADDVAVTVVRLGEASGAGSVPSSFEVLPDHLDEQPPAEGRLAWNPYWLTVEGGEVVAIDEQYLP
jgi:hypothetical protein